MKPWRASVLLCLSLGACSFLEQFGIGGDPAVEAVSTAKQTMSSGDLPPSARPTPRS
jgi:hypothetical protein